MTKMDEFVALVKNAEAKVKEEKCSKAIKSALAVIGVIVVVAAIAFAVYKCITKCKREEECECENAFEEEASCIELEFVYPAEEDAVPAEAEEDAAEEQVEVEE